MTTRIYIQDNTIYIKRHSGSKRTSFQTSLLPSDVIHIIFYDKTHLMVQYSKKAQNWTIRAIYTGTRYHTVEREKSKSNKCLQSAIFSIQEEDEKIFRLRKEQLK